MAVEETCLLNYYTHNKLVRIPSVGTYFAHRIVSVCLLIILSSHLEVVILLNLPVTNLLTILKVSCLITTRIKKIETLPTTTLQMCVLKR